MACVGITLTLFYGSWFGELGCKRSLFELLLSNSHTQSGGLGTRKFNGRSSDDLESNWGLGGTATERWLVRMSRVRNDWGLCSAK